jgi:hypothetical protein
VTPRGGGVAALALLLGACFTPTQRREEALVREARQLNDDLRWARYDAVVRALADEEAASFARRASAVGEELVLADSEVTSIRFGTPSETATSVVALDWYTKRDPVVRKTTLEQDWRFRDGRWLVIKQRRVRGERFPLVSEPAAAAPGPAPAAP